MEGGDNQSDNVGDPQGQEGETDDEDSASEPDETAGDDVEQAMTDVLANVDRSGRSLPDSTTLAQTLLRFQDAKIMGAGVEVEVCECVFVASQNAWRMYGAHTRHTHVTL